MITIIIPTYNAAAYIKQTIDTVLNQTFASWHMIVVDDHSNDTTWDIISSYCKIDSRISAIRLDKNEGRPAKPRNIGAALAKTKWLAFLDADDIWHPEKLAIQLNAAEENGFDLICSRMIDFTDSTLPEHSHLESEKKTRTVSFISELCKNKIPTSSVIIKKDVFNQLGGFNESKDYKAIEDYDLWLRLTAAGFRAGKCNSVLLYYRIVSNSISRNKKNHAKKVIWLLKKTINENCPHLIIFFPLFIFSYISQSIYYRFFKRSL